MGNIQRVVVPHCKLYDTTFQRNIQTGYSTYDKKRDKWFHIYPNPYLKQKFIYKKSSIIHMNPELRHFYAEKNKKNNKIEKKTTINSIYNSLLFLPVIHPNQQSL